MHPNPPTRRLLTLMPRGQATYGPSRSTIYRAAAAGNVVLKKIGRATYIDDESMRLWLASLPDVQLARKAEG